MLSELRTSFLIAALEILLGREGVSASSASESVKTKLHDRELVEGVEEESASASRLPPRATPRRV